MIIRIFMISCLFTLSTGVAFAHMCERALERELMNQKFTNVTCRMIVPMTDPETCRCSWNLPQESGYKGPKGYKGIKGPTGQKGMPGLVGKQGAEGTVGEKGPQGNGAQYSAIFTCIDKP